MLLEAGADVDATTTGCSPIIHIPSVDNLIIAGADANVMSDEGENALVKTIVKAHDECLELLIQSGADVNFQLLNGNSVLLLAAERGNSKAVDLLIKGGADVNAVDRYDSTAMIKAMVKGCNKCLELLLRAGADVNHGHDEAISMLLEKGAAVNTLDGRNNTALYYAASCGKKKCVDLLLTAGADVNVVGSMGNTCLMQAAGVNALECVRSLIKAGVHVNKKNDRGENALMFLHRTSNCQGRKEEVTKLLFAAGEKVDGITYSVVECIRKEMDTVLNLKHLCRETIRKHLINIQPHVHLFERTPQLEVTSSLVKYLLYDLSL